MQYAVVHDSTPREFLDRSLSFLLEREPEHSLLLGVAQSLPPDELGPTLLSVVADGRVRAVGIRAGRPKMLLSGGPTEAIAALRSAVATRLPRLPGVMGPAPTVRAFIEGWPNATPTRRLAMRLHKLETIIDPPEPTGHVRVATPSDAEWLAPWGDGFLAESGSDDPRTGSQLLAPYLDSGTACIWEDPQPCALAGWSRGTPNGASVSLVYTPPKRRGRGYATALVARLSRELLSRGKRFCVLYTNMENPTANAIYARIGYRPIQDTEAWDLFKK